MTMKVYNKRGVHNYKEKKLEEALMGYFTKNPDKYSGYTVPTTYEDLKAVHDHLCIESVDFTETKADKADNTEETHESFRDSLSPETEDQHNRPDPMNRDEPIIREYVKNDGFKEDAKEEKVSSNYDEPTSFRDSFEMPESSEGDGPKEQIHTGAAPKAKATATPDPDAKLKKKSKRKFTKYAVDAFCALSGRLMIFYATKDITDQKLEEYIANDEISRQSLEIIVALDNETRGTVRQFFQSQCLKAQQLAEFTNEEKEDLSDALDDFLEYKKVEINPTVNIAVIVAGMMLQRLLGVLEIKSTSRSVLEQLKDQYDAYKNDHTDYSNQTTQESDAQTSSDEDTLPNENEDLKSDNDLSESDRV